MCFGMAFVPSGGGGDMALAGAFRDMVSAHDADYLDEIAWDTDARKNQGRGCAARDRTDATRHTRVGAAIGPVARRPVPTGRRCRMYLVVILALVAIVLIFVNIAVRRSERREAEERTRTDSEDFDWRLW